MKSKLQYNDKVTYRVGWIRLVKTVRGGELLDEYGDITQVFDNYTEDLKHINSNYSELDIVKVTRNNEIIWQRDEPIDINKMTTVIHNGQTYPLATHENMKILVDKISELEKEISNLKQSR